MDAREAQKKSEVPHWRRVEETDAKKNKQGEYAEHVCHVCI